MESDSSQLVVLLAASLLACAAKLTFAASEEMGNGFRHHGVATPVSSPRGIVATVDGAGRNVVLVWLFDHRGGYALLMIDAETGKADQIAMPFRPSSAPFASVLSSGNKFYTHFTSRFVEFDPAQRAFTFCEKTAPQMAMGMTEDDNGVIWAVTYPNSGVVSFNPATREMKDYGHVYKQNWAQYQRTVAADDTGWIYFGVGNTACQLIAFDPRTGKATPIIPEEKRKQGSAEVYRDKNGKVYGRGGKDGWHELYEGRATNIEKPAGLGKKPIISGLQGLFHRRFPDGKKIKDCDLIHRVLTVEDPATKEVRKLSFDYESEGAHIMGLAAAPDGTICGGTAFPMRFFSYNPKTDSWTNRACHGQWNTVARQGDRFFAGCYTDGCILEWNPSRDWVATKKGNADSNPLYLAAAKPTIIRPHDLLAHPDGKTLILAGTPAYGCTGGGLLFWDRQTRKSTLLTHEDILLYHSTQSLAALPGGKLLGGTTTAPGTGGERKAKQAELYIMDMATKRVEWHAPVFPGTSTYNDLCTGAGGLVYGFADCKRFFVFDPRTRKVVHEADTKTPFGSTNNQQGPRVFVQDPRGATYILFYKGIARLDPKTFEITLLANSPVPIGPGGDYLDGRIYFGSGSHVYSYEVPKGR
ncbi:MAG: hypothetical protein JXR37_33895 [Kiritimatiellae bacterium]|nr:hypothetical protein [Kiritimatiellia bacterium]